MEKNMNNHTPRKKKTNKLQYTSHTCTSCPDVSHQILPFILKTIIKPFNLLRVLPKLINTLIDHEGLYPEKYFKMFKILTINCYFFFTLIDLNNMCISYINKEVMKYVCFIVWLCFPTTLTAPLP